MAYIPKQWVCGEDITDTDLNHMELGIKSASEKNDATDALETQVDLLEARVDNIVAPSGTAPNPDEIIDARVGADGTQYDNLGNAIRGQVSDLKSDLSVLMPQTDFSYDLVFTEGKWLNSGTGGAGNSTGWAATLDFYPVTEGQKLSFNLYAYGSNEAAICFYTAKDYTTFISPVYSSGKSSVIVPSGAKYARFATRLAQVPIASAYVTNVIVPTDSGYLSTLESKVDGTADVVFAEPFKYKLVFTDGGFINYLGNVQSYSGYQYTADYYMVREGQKIEASLYAAGTTDVAVAFYNSAKAFISSLYLQGAVTILDVPEGASFARFSNIPSQVAVPYVKNYVEVEEGDSDLIKPYFPSSYDEFVAAESTVNFTPSTLRLDYRYKGEVNNEKRYIALGFDDYRASDFSMVIPLLEKYGARATFNKVSNAASASATDIIRLNNTIYGGHEVGDHTFLHYNYPYTLPLFNGQNPSSPEGSQTPYPTNDHMRVDVGTGKNALGKDLTASANIGGVTTAWGNLSDAECQTIREYYSVMKDSSLRTLLDTLSNKYLGTTGSSNGSWDSTTGKYTGGIFTGCATSANHEIWERILMITRMYYKDQFGLNWDLQTWSWPGSKGEGISFLYDGLRYYDPEHTKLINSYARFESSLYKDESGNNKLRSWNDVLEEFGYFGTHDAVFVGRYDNQISPMMSHQLILNSQYSRKNAIAFPTNRTIDYGAIASAYPESFFTGSKSRAAQMYDASATGQFRKFIEGIRHGTSRGRVHGEVIDSQDTYSERMFLEEMLKYCKATGVEVITKAEAYDLCFNHKVDTGNLMYNPHLRNTAKEFMPDAETVPNNPDGYSGSTETYTDEDGINVLRTTGTAYHYHFGIPTGKLRFSADVKGSGRTITVYAIRNSDNYDGSNNTPLLATMNINTSSFTTMAVDFIVPDNPVGEYEQRCGGYGDKIMGLLFSFSYGIEAKNMRLETI